MSRHAERFFYGFAVERNRGHYHFGFHKAGRDGNDRNVVIPQLVRHAEGQSVHRRFRQVIKQLSQVSVILPIRDVDNQAYVVGTTSSENFRTRYAAQRTYGGGGSDAFLTLFDSAGQIAASTYIGGRGRDSGAALATDNNGHIFVSGNIYEAGSEVESRAFLAIYSWTSFKQIRKLREVRKFPEYFAVYDQFLDSSFLYMVGFIYDEETGDYEATIIKTDRIGKMVALKKFGERVGGFTAIAGAGGSLYLTGTTYSTEFPTKNAYQNEFRGGIEIGDGFVMKISAKTFAVIYSSYLGGGEDDFPDDIAVDLEGTVFVVGQTKSFVFPTTPNALSRSFGGGFEDGFLVRIKE